MDQQQFQTFVQENFIYIMLGQMVFGLIIGLIPLILGLRKKKRNFGIIALVVSVISAAVSPLLSLLLAVVFIILILRKQQSEPQNED